MINNGLLRFLYTLGQTLFLGIRENIRHFVDYFKPISTLSSDCMFISFYKQVIYLSSAFTKQDLKDKDWARLVSRLTSF